MIGCRHSDVKVAIPCNAEGVPVPDGGTFHEKAASWRTRCRPHYAVESHARGTAHRSLVPSPPAHPHRQPALRRHGGDGRLPGGRERVQLFETIGRFAADSSAAAQHHSRRGVGQDCPRWRGVRCRSRSSPVAPKAGTITRSTADASWREEAVCSKPQTTQWALDRVFAGDGRL